MIDLSSPLESNIISLTAKLCERRSVGATFYFFFSVAEEGRVGVVRGRGLSEKIKTPKAGEEKNAAKE